ncbi:MAG: hypothetical protein LBK61_14395 [Spirochaetaceae bacterium]|nr:hypothetical protein [Spirochaetaceae bacterium]
MSLRSAPAGGENPAGFSSLLSSCPRFALIPSPILVERTAAWQAEHPLMAAVLPLRVRNAAIRGCSACRELCWIGVG